MKLLVDSQLPPALARHIDTCGTACIHVRDVGLARALDQTIWDYAKSHNLVIVSKDRDIRDMAILKGHDRHLGSRWELSSRRPDSRLRSRLDFRAG